MLKPWHIQQQDGFFEAPDQVNILSPELGGTHCTWDDALHWLSYMDNYLRNAQYRLDCLIEQLQCEDKLLQGRGSRAQTIGWIAGSYFRCAEVIYDYLNGV